MGSCGRPKGGQLGAELGGGKKRRRRTVASNPSARKPSSVTACIARSAVREEETESAGRNGKRRRERERTNHKSHSSATINKAHSAPRPTQRQTLYNCRNLATCPPPHVSIFLPLHPVPYRRPQEARKTHCQSPPGRLLGLTCVS